MYTADVARARKKSGGKPAATVAVADTKARPLLMLMLLDDGTCGINREPLDQMLANGIQYRALAAITRQMMEATGELLDLIIETRILTELDEKPVVAGPEGPQ